ncbi:c-type cytochrome biogenesis protein CcsB [Thermosynechococcaceae cyanobacterium BACA0444]|uniref:Cytochrome c biogenesis protein CcsA n=1 Tax=Pseudocalidococcus azoricus BACA0444 TaxID=2918990 RepID=A0AAE4JYA1_9CYAN|nr:c-type cytochrome biogenesis protein CcsB [Pseudocalidococcus azoricus]MDS3861973.1 c-type cytochrome biogenesis protein CcsB [Pseudocalidococcus azoricus BACA0444]
MDLVTLENWLDNTVFVILLATMLIYWVGAAFRQQGQWLAGLGRTGMILANLGLVGLLGARWIEGGYFPISNLYESLFFLCWGLTLMHLVAEGMSGNPLVGVVTAPLAMGIAAFATLTLPPEMQTSAPLVPALKSNWLMMHVSVMMLSYATLMVGALVAIAFLIVTRGKTVELKGNSIGSGGFRALGTKTNLTPVPESHSEATIDGGAGGTAVLTPAMTATTAVSLGLQRLTLAETLDNLSYRMIGLGFPLLTIGIISGAVWANEAWGAPWSWDPKETWALITWLVFAAYLHARITKGWQGRKPAIIATCGLGVVWVCYLGVNLLGKGLHSYGWFF